MPEKISLGDARKLFLHSQGLLHRNSFGRGKNAVLKSVEQLGYVQIDTISVIERAHHHVLKTRVENYQPGMLDELQRKDGKVFEYWSHAAAYLPLRDYRYYLPIMESMAQRYAAEKKMAKLVLERIKNEGPLQSRDFESPPNRKSTGWWDWKPAKKALECLFLQGELMVSRRNGFQKVYDLRERVLPSSIDSRYPTEKEWGQFIITMMINALGTGTLHDLTYIRQSTRKIFDHNIRNSIQKTLVEMTEDGEILEIDVNGKSYYTTRNQLDQLPLKQGKKQIVFLSPFDNFVINRKRTHELLNFDYQLECYVPLAKRRYGYFSLPVLYGEKLVGRMDSKADRKTGVFIVKNLQLEVNVNVSDEMILSLTSQLEKFARYQDCKSIEIEKSSVNLGKL